MSTLLQKKHNLVNIFLSCCCGKCAPKKPDEDEDCPDLGDLGGEEETEVGALAGYYRIICLGGQFSC